MHYYIYRKKQFYWVNFLHYKSRIIFMPATKKALKPVKFIANLYFEVLGREEYSDIISWTENV